ncbi:MAG: type II toxin-antitoxin system Phd/YefM family antitoxin, partial [Candidatus Anammoxibacter sp.]
MVYYMTMKLVNIAKFKNNFSKFLSLVEKGEEVKVCKRNVAIAKLIPIRQYDKKNH